MRRLLTLLAGGRHADHRVVFSAFARGLERVLRRPAPYVRVRVVRG